VQDRLDAQAGGESLQAREQAQLDTHLAECRDCRGESMAVTAMKIDSGVDPAPPLDDLARRRFVDATLARLDEVEEDPAPVRKHRSPRWVLWSLVEVAALIALVLTAALWWPPREASQDMSSGAVAVAPAAYPAQVLLVGGAASESGQAVELDAMLDDGSVLSVAGGLMAVGFGERATVLLDGNAEMAVRTSTQEQIELSQVAGTMHASVDPRHPLPSFAVDTWADRLVVVGTRFTVDVTEERVALTVYRGTVLVQGEDGESCEVIGGTTVIVGTCEPAAAGAEAYRADQRLRETLSLLQADSLATLHIRSEPAGASVILDGHLLGQTPLRARVQAENRTLELQLAGYASMKELLDLPDGGLVERHVELVPAEEEPTSGAVAKARQAASTGDPATALRHAQKLRSEGRMKDAAKAYQALIDTHCGSSEAQLAQVSLGTLFVQSLGRPEEALKRFDTYLTDNPGGYLAPEAAHGRILALRALGRSDEERQAMKEFVRAYPDAIQAPTVRSALDAGR